MLREKKLTLLFLFFYIIEILQEHNIANYTNAFILGKEHLFCLTVVCLNYLLMLQIVLLSLLLFCHVILTLFCNVLLPLSYDNGTSTSQNSVWSTSYNTWHNTILVFRHINFISIFIL